MVFFAFVAYGEHCSDTCEQKPWEQTAQLVIAFVCFGVALLGLFAALDGRNRRAGLILVGWVLIVAYWAVMLDAATHGWGSGPIPF